MDPRVDRGHNYDLVGIIFITVTAAVCGANGWLNVKRFAKAKIDLFRCYGKLENGIHSHDTFGRVISNLGTGEFLTAKHHWADHFSSSMRDKGVAIDGKVLRSPFDHAAGTGPLHTITAFSIDTKLVLRQMSVGDKCNEVLAVPPCLDLLNLS
ncbi:ISAs1 family transposase [Rosistilla ulvae]|uniref:ISAs1 family transposase n=1 Tax=Rosistilla ulvae TaxID=1930277 RepID=UPI0021BC9BB4|nr:ISAs1 family transposase [Rosistilla ulvae]